MDWDQINEELQDAFDEGWLVDYRDRLPKHASRHFPKRQSPEDLLGYCIHHSASKNQDPTETANYHVGPNHVCESGCPGLLYTFAISQTIEPEGVILANDLESVVWSQGKGSKPDHPEWSGDENRHLVSILVMGDFDSSGHRGASGAPSSSQIERLNGLVQWLGVLMGREMAPFGHFDFGKAACPGDVLRRHVECQRLIRPSLKGDRAWQEALLAWDPECLPKYGADGVWGEESRQALIAFERAHKHRVDGMRDPFTELLLLRGLDSQG